MGIGRSPTQSRGPDSSLHCDVCLSKKGDVSVSRKSWEHPAHLSNRAQMMYRRAAENESLSDERREVPVQSS